MSGTDQAGNARVDAVFVHTGKAVLGTDPCI
jgi:hypothetical protein